MNKAEKLARAARARALLDLAEEPTSAIPETRANKVSSEAAAGREAAGGKTARSVAKSTVTRSGVVLEPYYGTGYDPKHIPKKWEHPPKVGDLVFYRGERFFVESAPTNWLGSAMIRIGDQRPQLIEGIARPMDDRRLSFCVHADLLTAVPVDYNLRAQRLPTVASVARKERARAGLRDVGDEIATLLRGCPDLEAVYAAAAKYLNVKITELREKYGHLNPGQQRMNLGNKMRFKWRKEHV